MSFLYSAVWASGQPSIQSFEPMAQSLEQEGLSLKADKPLKSGNSFSETELIGFDNSFIGVESAMFDGLEREPIGDRPLATTANSGESPLPYPVCGR
ncbi:MAG: hypothetical protein AAFR30_16500 [Cyanobacteria bacterium J06628_4]